MPNSKAAPEDTGAKQVSLYQIKELEGLGSFTIESTEPHVSQKRDGTGTYPDVLAHCLMHLGKVTSAPKPFDLLLYESEYGRMRAAQQLADWKSFAVVDSKIIQGVF